MFLKTNRIRTPTQKMKVVMMRMSRASAMIHRTIMTAMMMKVRSKFNKTAQLVAEGLISKEDSGNSLARGSTIREE